MTTISDRQFEIIAAAGKILSAAGVSGLTIKNLAQEMNFSEGAIYRHFNSKEEIIIAMLTYLANSMDECCAKFISEEQSPEEKFMTLFRSQFSFFKKNPHFVVAVFSDGLLESSQLINETISKLKGVKMKHLIPIIQQGQSQGVFTNAITSDEMLHLVLGAFRLQMYNWRVANFQFDIENTGLKMIQSLLIIIKIR